jgi:nucleoside transporter
MKQVRLSIMMFLEFFVWGAWYVTVANYMIGQNMSDEIYWAFTVGPIAAIIAPFFLGLIADRFFPTERVLGIMHIIGGVAIFCAPFFAVNPLVFILMLGLHMLCYQPTIGLANTLAFHNIGDPEKEFPIIRMFGTIGWIVAGLFVSGLLAADQTKIPLQVAGIAGVILGFYSFTLPHTPPPAKGQKTTIREIAGIDALSKLSSRSFNVFLASSLLICIPLAAYYSYAQTYVQAAGFERPAFNLSFGQMSEAIFIVMLPFLIKRLGFKWTLFVGMLAWAVRYALFSFGAPDAITWMILTGIILHGICYDFFFVTGQIYVEKRATKEIRGQAQGLIVLVTYGIGMFIGAPIAGWIFNRIVVTSAESAVQLQQYQTFWILPAIFAAVIMIIFGILFKDDQPKAE